MVKREVTFHVTANLKELMGQDMQGMDEDEKEAYASGIGKRYFMLCEELQKFKAGSERYHFAMALIEKAFDGKSKKDWPCKKGCCECCKMLVTISWSEAAMLADYMLRLRQTAPQMAMITISELLAMRRLPRDPDDWYGLPEGDRTCPFLDERRGLCRVYANRPLACRSYYVITDPSLCELKKEKTVVGVVGNALVELLFSALNKVEGTGSMADMIVRELGHKGGLVS